MMQAQLHNSCATAMADILSAAFVFNKDLACKLEIKKYRKYFTAIENDKVSIHRAVVESGKCLSCFQRYLGWIWPATPVSELSWLEETVFFRLDAVS